MREELAVKQPEEVRRLLLEEGLFFKEAARRLLPKSYRINPKIASEVVSQTARLVLSAEEDAAVRARNFQTRQRLAGTLSSQIEALTAQEKFLWSDAERTRLRRLARSRHCQHMDGPHKGKPNVGLITIILNAEFEEERPARTSDAMRSELVHAHREEGVTPITRINWTIVRPELQRLARQSKYRYPADTGHPGKPNWNAIAAALCALFPDEPTITAKNCSM
jgi:hypothetical protein